jgi:predicted lysophospholipase L1 biosynthesis ABC-type transport system permease subunit
MAVKFWLWGVRNVCVVLAGLVAFAGYQGVADWSIIMVVVLAFALVAEVGNRIGRKALKRQRRTRAARAALQSATELRDRFRTQEQRRAA